MKAEAEQAAYLADMKENATGRNDIELSAEAQERRKQLKDESDAAFAARMKAEAEQAAYLANMKENATGRNDTELSAETQMMRMELGAE